jgi:hypothetical protein
MRKIVTVIVVAMLALLYSSCKVQKVLVQKDPEIVRGYVFDIPNSDDMPLKKYLPKDTYVIPLSDAHGKSMLLLVSKEEYEKLKAEFQTLQEQNDALPINRFIGMDLAISKIDGLSFISSKDISEMSEADQRRLLNALNPYTKYSLFGTSPKKIFGFRADAKSGDDAGKFFPDLTSDFTYSKIAPATTKSGTIQQKNVPASTTGQKKKDPFN